MCETSFLLYGRMVEGFAYMASKVPLATCLERKNTRSFASEFEEKMVISFREIRTKILAQFI
jgi:hypothetical protein